jgi:S-adenosylmethionine-dependent methyltransferase
LATEGELAAAQQAFADHAGEWDDYTRAPLGRLRERLVLYHLEQELQSRALGRNVLDAGGGTGGYALALAQRGYRVCLLDFSPEMLDVARQRLLSEDPLAAERIDFCCLQVQDLAAHFAPGDFDVVLCHTLLEYLEQPLHALCDLASVVKVGGVMSVLLANPLSEVLTSALIKKDPQRALQALSGPVEHTDLFGLPRRAVALDSVYRQFELTDVQPVAEYGVRIFADYLPRDLLADEQFLERLFELELAASELQPYADIARYRHILAVPGCGFSSPTLDLA